MNAAATPRSTSNVMTFDDMLETATQLGTEAGKGKDTQIKFLLKAVEGGYHNILDLTPGKHGPDVDDAVRLSEAYFKAQQGAVVFDAKAPNQRKLASTVRVAIRLGSWPKGGAGEPLATVNNLMTLRQNLRKKPENAKLLEDAANTLLKYARVQLKRDELLEADELEEFCFKPVKEETTAEAVLERMAKQLDKLIEGDGDMQDNSSEVISARRSVRKRLEAIATAQGAGQPTVGRAARKGAQAMP